VTPPRKKSLKTLNQEAQDGHSCPIGADMLLLVGRLEGTMDGLEGTIKTLGKDLKKADSEQWEALDEIRKNVTDQRVLIARWAGGLAVVAIVVTEALKWWFSKGGQ